jgi:uncharacterized SAM-binding protein YcdF (DUF218 family)
MYLLKQLVGALATPLTIALLVLLVAGLCRAFGRRRSAAWLVAAAAAIGYLGAIAPVGDALLAVLERQYPAFVPGASLTAHNVVVLGSDYSPHGDLPISAALDPEGLVRIVEGVRLSRQVGATRLVVSGGAPRGRTASAIGYAKLAQDLGIPRDSIVVLDTPLDTSAEATAVKALLGDSPFILVTSACHMPRAMRFMLRAGARPIPAPTGHRVRPGSWRWNALLPTARALQKTEHALHEYLGLFAYQLGLV